MCGIVGYIGTRAASNILIEGLRKLEYRGYDSAGVATVSEGELNRVRAKGKLQNLQDKLDGLEDPARLGIGHTRWATHGKPVEHNAHPHTSGRIAVVQNGIVENYRELRESLIAKGYEFQSETDTEVIPHLIADYLAQGVTGPLEYESTFLEAVRQAVNDLDGAFALAIVSADFPDELIAVRQQAPLAIGFGQGEFFCASDTPAIVPYTRAVLPLDNGELAMLTPLGAAVYDFTGRRLKKHPITLSISPTMVEKQGFKHFMLKEIHEQPGVVRSSLETYLDSDWTTDSEGSPIKLGLDASLLSDLNHVQILACGTSWHASLVGKHLLEHLAGIPTVVHYASEFRYSPTPLIAKALTIGVTQSGETADTLAALDMEQTRRTESDNSAFAPKMLGITNRPESSLGRMLPNVLATHAGIEIGVAATKTFVAQLMAFYFLALELAYQRKTLSKEQLAAMIEGMRQLPNHMEQVIAQQESYTEELAHSFTETQDFIFIGRGVNYPIALEGALKLKEISYIHAEGYPAGEMKHGPIALLDAKVPVVAIAVPGSVYDKVLSNAQEAKARDAQLIGVAPANDPEAEHTFDTLLPVPTVDELLSPMLTVLPLQLLSYHIAARRGLDVDQPRNLAKSVTVE
ncbi:glutamine--fructose-6-phosphate transaminase (isomerizing) [Leptolyngbya cf. ectocarpi LEGE 11479]|uniref:Glutamine--fructose-6-phosphate aminotransferase [isomerizing] n=1 Tax=Leptolyngbya cf. ectocarpi LEGE 11479 TaxID=1828722 RepID=A0A929F915_LEPEC|nr:glutamine--fructose-6-phosphate transaminase (isomerizing) [Leptolyngbya ectocarpi]MBE9069111.1 glutamine--fructose-6-phosphate transaminase (isomerizing) [Leptolyngbya cf. ectocarpi LEGE 11479]